MIVIINGPLGIGKTETAWELLVLFERAVMLDGDYLGAIQPFEIYDKKRVDYLYRTLAHVVAFHRDNGYEHFVINYVFEHPDSLHDLRQRLAGFDREIYAFRLVCEQEVLAERIRRRGQCKPAELVDWEIQRGQELVAIQSANAEIGDLGLCVDTTRLDARETAQVIWNDLHETVSLKPYDPAWRVSFDEERRAIVAALGESITGIYHIGSTAVPGLAAKPVIDILITVRRLEDAITCIAPLSMLGYHFVDYPENTGRRFFRKGAPRTHHVHIVAEGGAQHLDPIEFRDALRADPAMREAYHRLKDELAARYPQARARYSEAKGGFIQEVLARQRARGQT
jgi:GrpB-like predicted nucleotidyltransferase (UPF0157 family)